jgi:hypothetical protein
MATTVKAFSQLSIQLEINSFKRKRDEYNLQCLVFVQRSPPGLIRNEDQTYQHNAAANPGRSICFCRPSR